MTLLSELKEINERASNPAAHIIDSITVQLKSYAATGYKEVVHYLHSDTNQTVKDEVKKHFKKEGLKVKSDKAGIYPRIIISWK